ncbi:MAG: TonB-dependent receptor plug domain-containing protein, partial [Candidatus Binatia bacterium]
MRHKAFLLSALGAAMLASAEAATTPRDDLAELGLEELMQIEVTAASKHPQTAAEAPSAVTTITAEEIRRYGYRTLAEALRSVPGFYTSYDRNYGFVGVRGFLRPGDFNDRVLLLVNGHTYNDDIYQQAYVDPTFGIDLDSVERIEVVRGPGSALYGGNALFAVINVVTASARERPGIRVLAETGSFGRKRGHFSIGHVFDGVEVFASGSVVDVDGQDELFYREFDSPEANGGIVEDADGEQALSFFGSARWGDFSLQGGANSRRKHVPTAAYGTTFGDSDTMTVDSRPFAEIAYASEDLIPGVQTNARVYYDHWYYHGTYVLGAGEERVKNEDFGSSHWTGGELRARREIFAGNDLTVGTEYSYHPRAKQENYNLGGERFLDDERSFGLFGIYAQDEWSPLPGLRLVGGARFDRSYEGVEQTSPRAALIWAATKTTTVKLLYGEAFRAPNLYEQYYA